MYGATALMRVFRNPSDWLTVKTDILRLAVTGKDVCRIIAVTADGSGQMVKDDALLLFGCLLMGLDDHPSGMHS
jgi:hypothetical protein